MDTDDNTINIIMRAKNLLETQYINNIKNKDYCDIYDKLVKYLHDYCTHEWETDLIDLTPDKSRLITYCKHCFETK